MSNPAEVPTITGNVTVNVPVEHAFKVFTESFGSWWPADYHIGQSEMTDGVIDPHEGGRWFEKGADGSECDWGRVLAWEPSNRLVITWQINGMWQFDADPEKASEIEVRFTADGPEQTIVEAEHRNLGRLVGGQDIHDAISAGGGWAALLQAYAAVAGK